MLELGNIFIRLSNDFKNYYSNLTEETKLIFYIIIFLVFIASFFILIILDQKNKKIVKSKPVTSSINTDDNYLLGHSNGEIDEDNEKTRNLKEITDKLQVALENTNINLIDFEKDQEEHSIISYQELKQAANQDLNLAMNETVEPVLPVENTLKPNVESNNKFKRSAHISPIFGIQGEQEKPSVAAAEPVTEEVEMLFQPPSAGNQAEQFLTDLKKLRSDLN